MVKAYKQGKLRIRILCDAPTGIKNTNNVRADESYEAPEAKKEIAEAKG